MSFDTPQWFVLAPALIVLWLWIGLRSARTRVVRLLLLALLLFALAGPRIASNAPQPAYFLLVDRSASVAGRGLVRAREIARELSAQAEHDRGTLHVIAFGRGASVVAQPGDAIEIEQLPEHDDSDLAAALRLATASQRAGTRGEIVLVSDGVYTGDDPLELVPELRKREIAVHSVDVGDPSGNDVAISRVLVATACAARPRVRGRRRDRITPRPESSLALA